MYHGPLIPWTARASAIIVDRKINENIHEVRAALAGTAGQQRKSRVAYNFDACVRAWTNTAGRWQPATDVDIFEWLFLSDSNGTKLVNIASCPEGGAQSDSQCRPGGHGKKLYTAASLHKGQAS